jgi:hypothetical protein
MMGGLGVVVSPTAAVAESPAAAPVVPDRFVLRPSFTTSLGPVNAGAAFALKVGDRTVLVTALHLLGPAGGLKAQVTADRLAEVVQSVGVRGAFTDDRDPVAVASKVLPIEGAHPMGDDASGDILVLEPEVKTGLDRLQVHEAPKLAPGSLAAAAPAVGDPVWLAARIGSGETRVHAGKVVELNDKWLFYEFASASLDLAGTNGAPVLNAEGKVVGIQLGGGVMDDGKLVGAANPWPAVKEAIDSIRGGG